MQRDLPWERTGVSRTPWATVLAPDGSYCTTRVSASRSKRAKEHATPRVESWCDETAHTGWNSAAGRRSETSASARAEAGRAGTQGRWSTGSAFGITACAVESASLASGLISSAACARNSTPSESEVLDLESRTVTPIASPRKTRISCELVALDDQLYLCGGSSHGEGGKLTADRSIECDDPSTNTWSVVVEELPLPMQQMRALAPRDRLLLVSSHVDSTATTRVVDQPERVLERGHPRDDPSADARVAMQGRSGRAHWAVETREEVVRKPGRPREPRRSSRDASSPSAISATRTGMPRSNSRAARDRGASPARERNSDGRTRPLPALAPPGMRAPGPSLRARSG